jgi:hypothetical protein
MRPGLKSIALLLGVLAFSTPASAVTTLIGDVIFADEFFPCDTCEAADASFTVNPFTVGPSIETSLSPNQGFDFTEVDFDASSLVFTVLSDITYNPGAFNGPEFTVLSGNPFGNVVSVSSPAGQPVTAHVSGGVLYVNWQGDSFLANDTITITFDNNGVPEPSTWAMMLIGFLGLGFAFRQSRRRVSCA